MPSRDPLPEFDLYKELEVDREATIETIIAAYRSLAKRFHPDVSSSENLSRIQRMTVARRWLTDPELRSVYDAATDPATDSGRAAARGRSTRPRGTGTIGSPPIGRRLAAAFEKHGPGPYRFAVGEAPTGDVVVTDLAKSPHMLAAGDDWAATDDWIDTFVFGLLRQATPEQLKFIPIGLEWDGAERYAGVPHLLTNPVVKVRYAVNALRWTVGVAEARQFEIKSAGASDIDVYNRQLAPVSPKMPRIVLLIGGLHELLEVEDADIEILLMRLALTAASLGIHLIILAAADDLADIPGLIRTIPTRVAFTMADPTASLTMIRTEEASDLGDSECIYLPSDTWDTRRCRRLSVDARDLDDLLDRWRAQGGPDHEPPEGDADSPPVWQVPPDTSH